MVNPQNPLYLTALTVIANILIHLWLILPCSLYGKEMPMANKNDLTKRQLETLKAIKMVNEIFGERGYGDVSDFMRGIAATETQLGKLQSPVSYSPFQIDPIRYEAIVNRAKEWKTKEGSSPSSAWNRAELANKTLRELGFGEGFDILSLSGDMEQARNPMVGAFLTRMALASIPSSAGDFTTKNTKQQSEHWKDYWNSHAKGAAGTPQKYISEKKYFDSLLNLKAYDNTVLE